MSKLQTTTGDNLLELESYSQISPGSIMYNAQVQRAKHEYAVDGYQVTIADTFNSFAQSCMDSLAYDQENYPRAVMHVDPIPADIVPNTVSYMVVWGAKTEIPQPRIEQLPQYFGRFSLMLARRDHHSGKVHHKEKTILDGYGFVGRVSLSANCLPVLKSIVGGDRASTVHISSVSLPKHSDIDLAVTEIMSDLKVHRPLRFHIGLSWFPVNQHIRNVFYEDDESRALDLI